MKYDGDSGSNEIDERYRSEIATSGKSADVMWSSAMDLQMQLVNEGYAAVYHSPESEDLPETARYEDMAFGTTFEPVVFVYNTDLLTDAEIPRNHKSLADLAETDPKRFHGKITSFDISRSGVGYMLAVRDLIENPETVAFQSKLACAGAHCAR